MQKYWSKTINSHSLGLDPISRDTEKRLNRQKQQEPPRIREDSCHCMLSYVVISALDYISLNQP